MWKTEYNYTHFVSGIEREMKFHLTNSPQNNNQWTLYANVLSLNVMRSILPVSRRINIGHRHQCRLI